jgi:hypothetical protein
MGVEHAPIVVEGGVGKSACATKLAKTCENSPLRFTRFIVFLLVAAGNGQSPAPISVYRLDDQFKSPAAASATAPVAEMATPIVWQNFLSEDDIT